MYFVWFIFLLLHSTPQPLQPLICHRSQLLVDCYVFQWKGGHLRPDPGASLYFMLGLFLSPWTGEPSAAPPNLTGRALRGPIESSITMSWWCRWPTHEGRGPKPLEGRAAAAHVGCCVFFCLCFMVWASEATLVVESWHEPRQNGQLLHTHTIKSAAKDLRCKCRSHTIAICRCGTRVDILAQISFWLINRCTKSVLNAT